MKQKFNLKRTQKTKIVKLKCFVARGFDLGKFYFYYK